MLPTITSEQFKSDISGLIEGTITSVNGLSGGCDKTNSTIVGTYPSGIYSRTSQTTYTFSKIHSTDNSTIHYFRLTFSGSQLTTFSLARSYSSETDTLVNSAGHTVNITTYPSSEFNGGITITITDSALTITSIFNNVGFGVFDIGSNGITSTYASNMKMVYINLLKGTCAIPYGYAFTGQTSGYLPLEGMLYAPGSPETKTDINSNSVVAENPAFVCFPLQGYAAYGVNKMFKIPMVAPDYQYNTTSITRQTGAGYAIVTE